MDIHVTLGVYDGLAKGVGDQSEGCNEKCVMHDDLYLDEFEM